ncbi:MAG: hypothetical protein ACPG5W_02690 [Flavobacteriales bacterium]
MDAALLRIGFRVFEIEIATCYDELTVEQFKAVAYHKCTSTDRKALLFELLMLMVPLQKEHLRGLIRLFIAKRKYGAAFNALTMLVWFDSRKLWKFLQVDDVIDALPSIEWVFDQNAPQKWSKVKEFTHENVAYYGPRNGMNGICWKQMQHADAISAQFANAKNEDLLNDLAAILYLPKGEAFNDADDSVNYRITLFKKLPIEFKYAVYVNYVQLRESFYRGYVLPQSTGGSKPDWMEVTLSVAGAELGEFNEVGRKPAAVVMARFSMLHKQRLEMEKNNKT